MYLPGQFIYHDIGPLNWFQNILDTYKPTGNVYQISALPNGNKVIKYPIGIAVMCTPFFFLGHAAAGILGYPQDGFSAPYQLAICLAALFYALVGLWLLRWVLRRFFSDGVAAFVLLMVTLASNYVQYVAVDSGMTHGYLFTFYAFILFATIRWHEKPSYGGALLIGGIIGLSAISRPTEGVMLFIPLLWNTHTPEARKAKWDLLLRTNRSWLFAAALGGFIGMLPQLVYWKVVTGKWIYDVGSKFTFFKPHLQVLFGCEKGWFVYTPIAIFMVAGLFLMRKYPFKRTVLTYFIINVWIVIAWADWRYGASYSCRALMQSYPVMALPLGILIQKTMARRWKWAAFTLGAYLLMVNLFQIWQYNKNILHYNDNNCAYYRAIYLNATPTPLDMSLLDTREIIRDESKYDIKSTITLDSVYKIKAEGQAKAVFWEDPINRLEGFDCSDADQVQWLHLSAQVFSLNGADDTWFYTELNSQAMSINKKTRCRMENGICEPAQWNMIEYYFKIPAAATGQLSVYAETKAQEEIAIRQVKIQLWSKK